MKRLYFLSLFVIFAAFPAFADVFDDANGTWGTVVIDETGKVVTEDFVCDGRPLHIQVNRDTGRFVSYHDSDLLSEADIIAYGDRWFSLQYDNEERVMDDGNLHVWILFMTNSNKFHWIRQDWIVDDQITKSTSPRHRCEPAIS